jgi:hypothetical protein
MPAKVLRCEVRFRTCAIIRQVCTRIGSVAATPGQWFCSPLNKMPHSVHPAIGGVGYSGDQLMRMSTRTIAVVALIVAWPSALFANPEISHPSYRAAQNQNLGVGVDEVLMSGDKGYLSKDRNWIQLHLLVSYRTGDTITPVDVKSRQADGVAIDSATGV